MVLVVQMVLEELVVFVGGIFENDISLKIIAKKLIDSKKKWGQKKS